MTNAAGVGSILGQLQNLPALARGLGYLQQLATEQDPYKRELVVLDAMQWGASMTNSKVDDELAGLVVALMKTKESEALTRWIVAQLQSLGVKL
jgi:hypothetical protein